MGPQAQAVGLGGEEVARRLRGRESAALAEDIGVIGELAARDLRQRVLAEEIDVGIGLAVELRRDGVGAEVGGGDALLGGIAQPGDDAEHLLFRALVQAVARLDLERRGAATHGEGEAALGQREQLHVGGLARGRHGRADAAAAGRDLLVALALDAALELVDAIAAEDEVRVRINEARRDHAPAGIDLVDFPARQLRRVGRGPGVDDAGTFHVDRRVVDDSEVLHPGAGPVVLRSGERNEFPDVDDGESHSGNHKRRRAGLPRKWLNRFER